MKKDSYLEEYTSKKTRLNKKFCLNKKICFNKKICLNKKISFLIKNSVFTYLFKVHAKLYASINDH